MAVRLPAEERRRQLLDVALEVFAEGGFHKTSMDSVAERAGVTKPVLYQHFDSKRALYSELLEDTGRRLRDAILAATAGAKHPHGQVEAGFAAYFGFVAEYRSAFNLLFGGGSRRDLEFSDTVIEVEESLTDALEGVIGADVPSLDPGQRTLVARAIVGLAEHTGRQWIRDELEPPAEVIAHRLASFMWYGLRGVGSN
jgi:AcrR family transcriptional regulator